MAKGKITEAYFVAVCNEIDIKLIGNGQELYEQVKTAHPDAPITVHAHPQGEYERVDRTIYWISKSYNPDFGAMGFEPSDSQDNVWTKDDTVRDKLRA